MMEKGRYLDFVLIFFTKGNTNMVFNSVFRFSIKNKKGSVKKDFRRKRENIFFFREQKPETKKVFNDTKPR